MELRRVRLHRTGGGVGAHHDLHVGRGRGAHEGELLADRPRDVHRGRLGRPAPREGEDLLDHALRPARRRGDLLGVLAPDGARREIAGERLGVAEDRREHVVEVVGDAARERPERLDLLGLPEPLLQRAALRLRAVPVGDVPGHRDDLPLAHRDRGHLGREGAPVEAQEQGLLRRHERAAQDARQPVRGGRARLPVDALHHLGPDEVLGPRRAGEPGRGGVRVGDGALRVVGEDAVGEQLEQVPVPVLGGPQGGPRRLLVREVAGEGDDERRPLAAHEREPGVDGVGRPVLPAVHRAEARDARRLHVLDELREGLGLEPVHEAADLHAHELVVGVAELTAGLVVRVHDHRRRVVQRDRVGRVGEELGEVGLPCCHPRPPPSAIPARCAPGQGDLPRDSAGDVQGPRSSRTATTAAAIPAASARSPAASAWRYRVTPAAPM